MTEPAKPGIFDRLRARFGWLDHIVRAYQRFDNQNGSFYAAGLTYYTIFALFPLIMVGFAAAGILLSHRPDLLNMLTNHIRASVNAELGHSLVDVMNKAIKARASVGIIGLATAAWAGLGWVSHLRVALTEMWWEQRIDTHGFFRTKLSDLFALVATFAVFLATIALTALGRDGTMQAFLRLLGIPDYSVFDDIFEVVSVLISLLVQWLLFTWMIARMPRKGVSIVGSMRAGLIAAVGFELFKQVGSVYLQVVLRSPASAAFGPVLGLMVFAYITAYLVLFATAWAATASNDLHERSVEPPAPAIIAPRVQLDEGLKARQTMAAMAAGAIGALTFSRLTRRRR
jgi:membrane protein